MINLEQYKQEKIAINTRTQKEYDSLMKFFDEQGIVWRDGDKATLFNAFNSCKGGAYLFIDSGKIKYEGKPTRGKIIVPTDLQEYNEFMGKTKEVVKEIKKCTVDELVNDIKNNKEKYDFIFEKKEEKPKYITTHAELLKLHGRSVTCKIKGVCIEDAKICVGRQPWHNVKEMVCICCSTKNICGIAHPNALLGYEQAFWISMKRSNYEDDNRTCTEIKLKEVDWSKNIHTKDTGDLVRDQDLTIGQAIDYMLESEENVIEVEWTEDDWFRHRIKDNQLQFIDPSLYNTWNRLKVVDFKNWLKIRKHIEPKQKTLKELMENKEEFFYKGEWYDFNVNGAILNRMSSKAVSLETIKELITITEE